MLLVAAAQMSGPQDQVSPFNPGAVGAGDAGADAVTTRFWWVRHAPVDA